MSFQASGQKSPSVRRRLVMWVGLLSVFLASTFLLTQMSQPVVQAQTEKEVVAYFTQWGIYGRDYKVKDIVTSGSAETITTINYAFGNIVNNECIMVTQLGVMDAYADYQKSFSAAESVDGVADTWDQPLRGNFNQLKKLKAMYPNIKVVISLGGWTWSEGFSDAALTPQSRQQVVASCIDLYIKGNLPVGDGAGGQGAAAGVFDGIDIDWEYPAVPGNSNNFRPEDTQNFTLLLQEFRTQLDALEQQTGEDYLLTVATGVGVDKFEKLELDKIHLYLDWINIMSYDMHGGWENTTNFHAPIYNSPDDPSSYPANTYSLDYGVQAYIAGGVPANKIVVGVPFYGRGWTNVNNANNGLYQSAGQAAPGTYEAGIEDYKVLKNLNYPSFRDPITRAFWVFNGTTFWSYDDATAIEEKMQYIVDNNLRGAMAWSLDGDDSSGTLMQAIANGLGNAPNPTATPGGTTVPPTSTPVVPPTSTPVVPPTGTPSGGCTAPAWDAGAVYTGGDEVSHAGHQWRAKWWTQGEAPTTTGEWGVWEDLGSCGSSTPQPTAVPTQTPVPTVNPTNPAPTATPGTGCSAPQYVAGTTYTTGQQVQNVGNLYQCTVGGWCSSAGAWAYEPSVGLYWQEAWTLVSACN